MGLPFLMLLLFLIVLLTAHLLLLVRGNYLLSIFQFLFSFFAVYGFGLYDAQSAIADFHGADVLPLCWGVVLVGLAGIAIGYRVFPDSVVNGWPHLRVPSRINRLGIVGIVLFLIGLASELYFIQFSGGTEAFFSQARGAGAYEETTAYLYGGRWLWLPGLAFLVAAGTVPGGWRAAAVCGLTIFGGYSFVLGQRTGIFLTILVALYTQFVWSRRLPKMRSIVLALVVTGVLSGFLSVARGDFRLGSEFTTVRTLLDKSPSEFVAEMLHNNLRSSQHGYGQTTEIVLFAGFISVFPHAVDYDYFKYYTSFLYAWIPRLIWPSRPNPAQEKVDELVAVLGTSHRSGPTPTILGMYYMHLGVFSVFLLSLVTGLYLAFVDANGMAAVSHPSAAVVFISMGSGVLSMPMGLGVLASIPTLLPFTVVPVVAGLWWAQAAQPRLRSQLSAHPTYLPLGGGTSGAEGAPS